MKIFNGFDELSSISNPVLTIGTFDGVHLGHQKIINHLNKQAEKVGGESVLFTFYPHPRMVLYPESHGVRLLQTQEEKLDKLERMGLRNIIIHPFTKEFSRLTALEFVRDYLVNKLKVKQMVIGYDHQFGKNREGSIDFLRDICDTYDFEVFEISAKEIDEVNISSTKIRKALEECDIEGANLFLGEPFELNGVVVKGKGIGKKLGYATANIDLQSDVKIVPGNGVYLVNVVVDGEEHQGMLNIGTNPTVSSGVEKTIEVHVLDLDRDLYGKKLKLKLISFIRPEKKFENVDQLVNQIKEDEVKARSFFNTVP